MEKEIVSKQRKLLLGKHRTVIINAKGPPAIIIQNPEIMMKVKMPRITQFFHLSKRRMEKSFMMLLPSRRNAKNRNENDVCARMIKSYASCRILSYESPLGHGRLVTGDYKAFRVELITKQSLKRPITKWFEPVGKTFQRCVQHLGRLVSSLREIFRHIIDIFLFQ